MSLFSTTLPRVAALAVAAIVAATSALACSSDPAKTATACKPGKAYYCRCINIEEEGEQTCNDEGTGFGRCEPCISDLPPEDAGPEPEAGPEPCGDGKVESGELCDDGNKVTTDFCSNTCVPNENPKGAGNCPSGTATGLAVHLWGAAVELTGNTTDYGNLAKAKASCGGASGVTSNDRVYVVVPHKTGPVTVTVTGATFNSMLFARSICGDLASEVGCANDKATSGDERLVVNGTVDTPIYVFVDGAGTAVQGTYTIRFEQ